MKHPDFVSWNTKHVVYRGLKNIGQRLFMEYINKLDKSLPLIDLGSGNGFITSYLINNKLNVIPVDPIILSNYFPSIDNILFRPLYETVKQMIIDKPNIVGNCNLLLNWCNPSNNSYDYEAIKLLDPKNIIVITELTGGANSPLFHTWLRKLYPYFKSINMLYNNSYICDDSNVYSLTDLHRLTGSVIVYDEKYHIQIAIMKITKGNSDLMTNKIYDIGIIE